MRPVSTSSCAYRQGPAERISLLRLLGRPGQSLPGACVAYPFVARSARKTTVSFVALGGAVPGSGCAVGFTVAGMFLVRLAGLIAHSRVLSADSPRE